MSSTTLGKALLAVLLIPVYLLVRSHHSPPVPVGMDAPNSEYAAERAFEHVLEIASAPHPAGTAQANNVRDYIVEQIRNVGLEAEVQEQVIYRKPVTFATVHNVLARIEGRSTPDHAVLLMAHYDSVAFGPGAADDASGVAALLEAMRAISNGPAPMNSIIFLFTDGEEGRLQMASGLRGAHAFVEHHPRMDDVRVVINFDARGVRGLSYMYQTSGYNAWLIGELARSGSRASATSLMDEVYKSMPLGSDLTAFVEAGVPGYDCAFIHGLEKYHTMLDSPEHLSLASLQHHGEYALTLARHLANRPLELSRSAAEDVVYFDIFGHTLIHYGFGTALVLGLLALFFYGVLFFLFRRRGIAHLDKYVGALVLLALWTVLCLGLSTLVMVAGYKIRGVYILYSSDDFTLAAMLFCFGASVIVLNRIMDRQGAHNTLLAFLFPWVLLLAISMIFMPGASYIFVWPLLFAYLPLGLGLFHGNKKKLWNFVGPLLLAIAATPTLLFMTGLLQGMYAALLFIFVPLHVALLLLTMALLMPHLRVLTAEHRRLVSLFTMALGGIFLLSGIFWPGFNAEQPKFNSITYALNADTNEAYYLSCDEDLDEWTAQFFPDFSEKSSITAFIPHATHYYLKAPAPVLPLDAPVMELKGDSVSGSRRSLHLVIESPRNAEVIEVYAEPGTQVRAATVNGIPMEIAAAPWHLSYSIYRGGGIDLVLEVDLESPAEFRVADHKYFLEDLLEAYPRPTLFAPKPNTIDFNRDPLKSDESIVVKTFAFTKETET